MDKTENTFGKLYETLKEDAAKGYNAGAYEEDGSTFTNGVIAFIDGEQLIFIDYYYDEEADAYFKGVYRIARAAFLELPFNEFVKRYNEAMYYNTFEVPVEEY